MFTFCLLKVLVSTKIIFGLNVNVEWKKWASAGGYISMFRLFLVC